MRKVHNATNTYPFSYQVVVLFYIGKEVESGMKQLNGMARVGNLVWIELMRSLKWIGKKFKAQKAMYECGVFQRYKGLKNVQDRVDYGISNRKSF